MKNYTITATQKLPAKNVLQKSGCGWTSSWNRSPVFRYLKVATEFLQLYGYLQEAPQYFESLLQTFLVVNGGKMIAGQQAGPIRKKKFKTLI